MKKKILSYHNGEYIKITRKQSELNKSVKHGLVKIKIEKIQIKDLSSLRMWT